VHALASLLFFAVRYCTVQNLYYLCNYYMPCGRNCTPSPQSDDAFPELLVLRSFATRLKNKGLNRLLCWGLNQSSA
jgi:hypothetical protein